MKEEKEKQYIYIAQSSTEALWCKIGMTGDLEERLKDYNRQRTGKSKDNIYHYLFTCDVKDMRQVEKDITEKFKLFRQESKTEIYLCTPEALEEYIKFIKAHPLFIEEVVYEKDTQQIKYSTKTSPPLKERGKTKKDIMERAKRVKNDEFYTRYEDIEKEIAMYNKNIWKDKVVFCNCDDAVNEKDDTKTSPFALYFIRNFKELGLKKLICTHYASKVDLFNAGSNGYAYFYVLTKMVGKDGTRHQVGMMVVLTTLFLLKY